MTSEDQKAARLAAALRANLAKRKAQKRARDDRPGDAEPGCGVDETARPGPEAGTAAPPTTDAGSRSGGDE